METFELADGRTIAANTLGGTIASVRNLAQAGTCWVFPGSSVEGNAYVSGNAIVQSSPLGRAGRVRENAQVYGNALIRGGTVSGHARVLDNAVIEHESTVTDEAAVYQDAKVLSAGSISGRARVLGEAIIDGGRVRGDARVSGSPLIRGLIEDQAHVSGCPDINAGSIVRCNARVSGCVRLINAILDCNAVVYGNRTVENVTINDAGLVTVCPDKGTRDCCS